MATSTTAPPPDGTTVSTEAPPMTPEERAEAGGRVRDAVRDRDMMMPAPPTAPPAAPTGNELASLGQMLAFDKILSGNGDISCMTCHHPTLGTSDARSLPIGVDGLGLGPDRVHPTDARIARNSPALFNLGGQPTMFWDGRVAGGPGGLVTPAGAAITPQMEATLTMGAVAAQAMFPVTSHEEMRGAAGENELSSIADDDVGAIWEGLMARLGDIPEYVQLFEDAYPGETFESMTFAHAANAIAAFEVDAFRADNTPWDAFVAGEDGALSDAALRGADLFFGPARCVECHRGPAFSDFQAHNTAVPQVGPGAGHGPDGNDDYGREGVTGDPRDRYAFRTTPLRNVELTAPYGHDGTFLTLESFIAHYANPERALRDYNPAVLEPALRDTMLDNHDAILATLDPEARPVPIGPRQIAELAEFLRALTDPRDYLGTIPDRVPSGLPVAD